MNLSRPFIERPVGTALLTAGVLLAGTLAYTRLAVAPLPQVDYPTISVSASLPGADPETVATSVAAPLERYLGEIADVTEITSQSATGQTRITLQFDLDRDRHRGERRHRYRAPAQAASALRCADRVTKCRQRCVSLISDHEFVGRDHAPRVHGEQAQGPGDLAGRHCDL